jgi:hypothetical protein
VRRWAFNVAAAVSLLLFVGTAVLWVRSYRHYDRIVRENAHSVSSVGSAEGFIEFWRRQYDIGAVPKPRGWLLKPKDEPPPALYADAISGWHWWDIEGGEGSFMFAAAGATPMASGTVQWFSIRHRSISLSTAFLPAVWIVRLLSRRQVRLGFCRSCGYD